MTTTRTRPPQRRSSLNTSEAGAGRIAGVFGLRGELKLAANRIGRDALKPGLLVRATLPDGTVRELRVRSVRMHQGRPLLAFEQIDDAGAAQMLTGARLTIARADASLRAGEYFDDDLVGCSLIDAAGRVLARVTAVEHYPAQDVLRVDVDGSERFVPLVRAFVQRIDLQARQIAVELPPGLLDGGAEEA